MKKIKVLIADDSALMRRLLTEILSQDPEIDVVGAVSDAYKAREQIKKLDPDVLTLDIEMPKMDGISFLERLMRLRPMPVVMISTMTEQGADITMKALMLGAVDFISKPKIDIENSLGQYSELIREKVKTAAQSQFSRKAGNSERPATAKALTRASNIDLIGIGASTGGVEAINKLLRELPEGLPPIVITQHIPPVFSASFANRLNSELTLTVCEARDSEKLLPGHVYVAPGDQHLLVARRGKEYIARLSSKGPVNRHMPSVEVLFMSIAESAGSRAMGIMLTGMGNDGAIGLLKMKDTGSTTIAQDEASSVVWGMPREAIEIGAVNHVLALEKMPAKIVSLCDQQNNEGDRRGSTRP